MEQTTYDLIHEDDDDDDDDDDLQHLFDASIASTDV
jgi:hypothetical protein